MRNICLKKTIDSPAKAKNIARHLVENLPSHDFVICSEDAVRLGLPVRPITEYDQLDQARALHRMYEDGGSEPIISFTSLADLLDTGEEEGGQKEASSNGHREGPEESTEASIKAISSEFGSISA
jgi:hypothetical protein